MKGAALLLLMVGVAFPLVVGYHVDPISANLSGWTHRGDTVSEVLTTNFDSLTDPAYIECFVGDGNPTGYKVQVLTYPDSSPTLVAEGDGDATRGYSWVRFDTLTVWHPELIVKGRQLEVRFSRASGSDSIQFYWAEDPNSPTGKGPYLYGHMIVGGQATAA